MCLDPMTAISGGMAIGGAAMNLFGASRQADGATDTGFSQASSAIATGLHTATGALDSGLSTAYGADLARQTADINAKLALQEGSLRVGDIDSKVNKAIGATRASAGASNIDVNSGSPLMMQVFSAMQGNVDKQLTMARAENEATSSYYGGAQDEFKAVDALRGAQLRAADAMQGGALRATDALKAAQYGAGTAWLNGAAGAVKSLAGFGGFSKGFSAMGSGGIDLGTGGFPFDFGVVPA